MNITFKLAITVTALLATALVNAAVSEEDHWRLIQEPQDNCSISLDYDHGKANGTITITRYENSVHLVLSQHEFGSHEIGKMVLTFDNSPKMNIDISSRNHLIAFDLERRLADVFIESLQNSNTLKIDYPTWPEEYPVTIELPSKEIRDNWKQCVKAP
jgi:hypothetical protein